MQGQVRRNGLGVLLAAVAAGSMVLTLAGAGHAGEPGGAPPAQAKQGRLLMGIAIDRDSVAIATDLAVMPPVKFEDLRQMLESIERDLAGAFKDVVIVARSDTPKTWVDDLRFELHRAHIRRVALRVDDRVSARAHFETDGKEFVAPWKKLLESVTEQELQLAWGPVTQVQSQPAASLIPADVPAAVEACSAMSVTIPEMHNDLTARYCWKTPSCAGECDSQIKALFESRQGVALATCKAFAAERAHCSPISLDACAFRWVAGRLRAVVAAASKDPLVAPYLPKCRSAGLLE